MPRKRWVRLDNASNVFLAARNNTDTKVFRLSAALTEPVEPSLLQEALDKTFDQYVLYHSVLRRGVFWYYLEESDLRPKVQLETKSPNSQIYHFDRKELLFRVLYRNERVHLEVFHALSDGTGALWFFRDMLTEYLFRRYEHDHSKELEMMSEHVKEQLEDSFFRHFRHRRHQDFSDAAESALSEMKDQKGENPDTEGMHSDYSLINWRQTAYQIEGEKALDNRVHVTELTMPVKQVLQLAKKEQVSLTVYLAALFMQAVHKTSPKTKQSKTIRMSVPVNLRQFFHSNSPRNFFTTVYLAYKFSSKEPENMSDVYQSLQKQLKQKATKEYLQKRLNQLIAFEFHPFIRVVIRPLKDMLLKALNALNNRQITIALSNLGKVTIPEPLSEHVDALYFNTSAIRPQMSVVSHQNKLTVSFSSPFIETEIEKTFVRLLTEKGIPVTVASNKVRYQQIEGGIK